MPHGSVRIGHVEILALCDGVVDSERPIEQTFPLVPAEAWDLVRRTHPDTISSSGRWRLHVHAFVLRIGGRTLLFDTGFGATDAPAFGWTRTGGRLMDELVAVSVDRHEVDTVLLSHAHDDHVGWVVAATGDPTFPNARSVLHRADWDWIGRGSRPENAAVFERCLRPLHERGLLELCEDGYRAGPGLTLRHAPGHTPGHQVLVIDSAGERGILSADTANHPVQLVDPTWYGTSDDDPDLAATTRAALLDLAEREDLLMATPHFPQPFGRLARRDGRRGWDPVETAP